MAYKWHIHNRHFLASAPWKPRTCPRYYASVLQVAEQLVRFQSETDGFPTVFSPLIFRPAAKRSFPSPTGIGLESQLGVVDCPTRWSLWYGYLDFYVDHLFRYPDDLRNIVQQCANLGGAITSTYIGIAMWKIKIIYSVLYFLTVALTHQSVIRMSLILTLKISIFPAM